MEQALVFASVVIGVAVAFEIEHFNKVLRSKNVKWHWAQPLFALFVLLAIIAFWWSSVIWSRQPGATNEISFGQFLPMMGQMILLALLAASSFPDNVPEEGLDLAEYYQENRVYQWSLFLLYFLIVHLVFVVRIASEATSLNDMAVVVPDTIFIALFSLMIFAKKWWQVALGFAVLSLVPLTWSTMTLT